MRNEVVLLTLSGVIIAGIAAVALLSSVPANNEQTMPAVEQPDTTIRASGTDSMAHGEYSLKVGAARKTIGEISGYDLSEKKGKVKVIELPNSLSEVSGLTFTHDGRLLCHNDEAGIVIEFDYRNDREVKRFFVGRPMIMGDFEGIAAKQDTLFLVASNGNLYRFNEGESGKNVKYQIFRTPLRSKNDVEGLSYDPESDCLLLACKADPGKGYGKTKAVYAFSLRSCQLEAEPRFLLPLEEIIEHTEGKEFNPSAIERHPGTGHFFVLAFNGFAMIEIDQRGKILGISDVRKSVNPQPEGLAIASDGTIIIANEGRGKAGRLAIYPPQ